MTNYNIQSNLYEKKPLTNTNKFVWMILGVQGQNFPFVIVINTKEVVYNKK
jgi:hypothetical protein